MSHTQSKVIELRVASREILHNLLVSLSKLKNHDGTDSEFVTNSVRVSGNYTYRTSKFNVHIWTELAIP
jgi:hypothetical protein